MRVKGGNRGPGRHVSGPRPEEDRRKDIEAVLRDLEALEREVGRYARRVEAGAAHADLLVECRSLMDRCRGVGYELVRYELRGLGASGLPDRTARTARLTELLFGIH